MNLRPFLFLSHSQKIKHKFYATVLPSRISGKISDDETKTKIWCQIYLPLLQINS